MAIHYEIKPLGKSHSDIYELNATISAYQPADGELLTDAEATIFRRLE